MFPAHSLTETLFLTFSTVLRSDYFFRIVILLAALTLVPLLTSRYGNIHVLTGKNLYEKFLMWFEKLIESIGHGSPD